MKGIYAMMEKNKVMKMKQYNAIAINLPVMRYEIKLNLTINENSISLDCSIIINEFFNGESTYLEKVLDKLSDSELHEILVLFRTKTNLEEIFRNEINNREIIKRILILIITNDVLIHNFKNKLEK